MEKTEVTFGRYEDSFPETDITKDKDEASIAIMGLAGEIGDLLSEFKKELRGDIAPNQHKDAICEEIGDCLWYLTKICKVRGTLLSKVLGQTHRTSLDVILDDSEAVPLKQKELASRLIIEHGKLVGSLSKNGNFEEGIKKLAILLASTAKSFNLTLGQAADFNINKTKNRFSEDYSSLKLYDEDFESFEQLPRELEVNIMEKKVGRELKAMLFIDDFIYGNPLEDNITGAPDHYRYHDVFHLAFATNLGWSPNLRALLSRKRKSKPEVDKNQDGGRARVMEEGIVHLVFRYGEENNFFKEINNPRVNASLLNSIEAMVKGFEVDDRPLSLWNKAICDGFRIFLQIKEHRHGKVSIDLNERTIKFET